MTQKAFSFPCILITFLFLFSNILSSILSAIAATPVVEFALQITKWSHIAVPIFLTSSEQTFFAFFSSIASTIVSISFIFYNFVAQIYCNFLTKNERA